MKRKKIIIWSALLLIFIVISSAIYATVSFKKEAGLRWLTEDDSQRINDSSYRRKKKVEVRIEQTENQTDNLVVVFVWDESGQLLEEVSLGAEVYEYQGTLPPQAQIIFELISEQETVVRYDKQTRLLLW